MDCFDHLFGVDAKGDELSRASFINELRELFKASDMDDDLGRQVDSFLSSVDLFLDLLLDVRSLPEGEEVSSFFRDVCDVVEPRTEIQYQEDRILSTLKLMSVSLSGTPAVGRRDPFR